MTHVEIVKTDFLHIREICETMRVRELEAVRMLREDPERMLVREVARSLVSFTGLVDGEVVVVVGARTAGVLSDEAYIWMFCSARIHDYPILFLRHAREGLEEIQMYFKKLYGLVSADFGTSIKWLRSLGFEVDPPSGGVCLFHKGGRPWVQKH